MNPLYHASDQRTSIIKAPMLEQLNTMMKKILNRLQISLESPSNRRLKLQLVLGIVLMLVSIPAVINSLEKSNYPGELERTQLGFDGEYIRKCFSSMSQEEFRMFIYGNLADYLFMTSYGLIFFSASLLLARRFMKNSIGRKIGYSVAVLGVLAAVSDGFENLFIISMVSNPVGFPIWLAIPHSVFANIKFNLMYVSAAWIGIALCFTLVRRILAPMNSPIIELEA